MVVTLGKNVSSEDGLPEGNLGRIGVAIAANKPNIVYALIESKKECPYIKVRMVVLSGEK